MIHVKDFTFIHAQRLDAVLIGVGVDGFFKSLAQNVLAAFWIGDKSIDRQHQVIGYQRVSS